MYSKNIYVFNITNKKHVEQIKRKQKGVVIICKKSNKIKLN
jgi:hypothetical protein